MSPTSSSSDQEITRGASSHSVDPTVIPPTPVGPLEPPSSPRGRTPARSARRSSRRHDQSSPPPARLPSSSPASSYRLAVPTIPSIGKWTVAGLRQALGNSDLQASRKMNKAELYDLYVSLKSTPKTTHRHSKARRAQNSPAQSPPSSPCTGRGSLRPSSRRSNRPSASQGRAPVFITAGPLPPFDEAQPSTSASAAAAPRTAGPSGLPAAAQLYSPAVHNPFPFQWPPAPVADTSAKLSPLASQTQQCQQFYPTGYNPAHFQWPAAQVTQTSAGPPPLAAQAHTAFYHPSLPPTNFSSQFTAGHPITRAPLTFAAPDYTLPSSIIQTKSPYSLFTATPMPVPPNAVAMEPAPVSQSIRAQILSEIQDAGSRGGSIPNSSSSLFRTNIPVTHPLKPLLDASLDSILQAVSPRTLQSYVTAWRCFKTFHVSYNLPFPDFSLLSITFFISYLNIIKGLQVGSIKGYLSGIQFFHKLMYGAPSAEMNNSQTSLLIKGIQRERDSKSPLEPLFLDESKKPVTRFWFQKHLKSVLQQSGIPAKNFSSHSFRIGAATSAAQKGLSQQQIQALGRWSSDAFQSYIRTNRFHIKKAHQTLIE
ncbi:uncharacterized protein LOC143746387 [Siphateles boraxobius]|uniref:uncharacterized protein LOC143746387 n=1 Tax=Siphateles boraxobius TaxID=180520 RepID=UPI00406333E6